MNIFMYSNISEASIQNPYVVELPAPVKKIILRVNTSSASLMGYNVTDSNMVTTVNISTISINQAMPLEFPIIRGFSPNTLLIVNVGATLNLQVVIEELGGKPDPDYWYKDMNGIYFPGYEPENRAATFARIAQEEALAAQNATVTTTTDSGIAVANKSIKRTKKEV